MVGHWVHVFAVPPPAVLSDCCRWPYKHTNAASGAEEYRLTCSVLPCLFHSQTHGIVCHAVITTRKHWCLQDVVRVVVIGIMIKYKISFRLEHPSICTKKEPGLLSVINSWHLISDMMHKLLYNYQTPLPVLQIPKFHLTPPRKTSRLQLCISPSGLVALLISWELIQNINACLWSA